MTNKYCANCVAVMVREYANLLVSNDVTIRMILMVSNLVDLQRYEEILIYPKEM